MKLSRESYYGLSALAYMATCPPGTILQADELAESADLPKTFLAKILYKLARHAILRSYRGKERGYELARAPKDLTVKEVVEVLDGLDIFERCVFWSNECSDDAPCPLHETWATVRPVIATLMEQITLAHVASGKHIPGIDAVLGPSRLPRALKSRKSKPRKSSAQS